jgi:glycosyltransferase involved in cell wall biosynthesis
MSFIRLLPVRDEAHIIGQSLEHFLQWADAVYVFDTGSVDATWEIVQDDAAKDKHGVALKKEACKYRGTMQWPSAVAFPYKRTVQRFVHSFCLPLLDRRRPAWPNDTRLSSIPSEITHHLSEELKEPEHASW